MAGRRQHIIPQFLLRNFAARVQGDEVFSWVYRQGRPAFCTNIKNVAVEGHFYGKPNDSVKSADEVVSSQEDPFARLVSDLLAGLPHQAADGSRIGPFIAHLSGRTKNLRLAFAESAELLIAELKDYFKTPGHLLELVKNHIHKAGLPDELFQQELPQGLNTPLTRQAVGDLILTSLPEFFAQNGEMLLRQIDLAFEQMLAAAPGASTDGQLRALRNFANDCPKAELFRHLKWKTVQTMQELILGDSGCLFKLAGDPFIRPFPVRPDDIEIVFFPISTNRLLVGTKENEGPHFNVEPINLSSARCSREYFVSALGPEQHGHFQQVIAEGAVFFTPEQIKTIATEVIADLGPVA
jgi:hypothetical protein